MSLENEIDKAWIKGAKEVVRDYAELAVVVARDEYAPRGATGNLQAGIMAKDVTVKGGQVSAKVVSVAEANGFDYAKVQHEERLYHINRPTQNGSFRDIGSDGGPAKRYRQGYYERVGKYLAKGQRPAAPRFATKYLDRALEDIEPGLAKDLEAL